MEIQLENFVSFAVLHVNECGSYGSRCNTKVYFLDRAGFIQVYVAIEDLRAYKIIAT